MKRKIKNLLFLIGLFFLGFMPNNVEALQCKYDVHMYNQDDGFSNIVIFKINTNASTVELPEIDRKQLNGYGYFWSLQDSYADFYLKQAKKNGKFHCPNIVLQNVPPNLAFVKEDDSINAAGYFVVSPETIIEDADTENEIEKVSDSCSAPVVVVDADGVDTIDESYTVSFKISTGRTKQWSIDDSIEYTIAGYSKGDWQLPYDDKKTFYLTKELLNSVYKNSSLDVSCPEKVYACKTGGDSISPTARYELYLSPSCSEAKKDYLNNVSLDGMNQSISCSGLFADQNEGSVYWLLQKILNYMKLLGPILVVLLSSVDFIKAVMSSDENAMKVAQKKLMVRLVAAIALFLLPSLIQLIISLLGGIIDSNCLLQ